MRQMTPEVRINKGGWFRRLFSFVGPAYLVSVGYMDPGNWATDIEGGARFGYTLIWVLLASNIIAILLQTLSARLGIVTGHDLAQACRREYPKPVAFALWILAEIAIAATDLAEAIGTIIGLNLLFGIPLLWGCAITAFDTFLFLLLSRYGIRKMEAFIVVLVATIGGCFLVEVFLAKPDWGGVVGGLVPSLDPAALYIAIGIIGATVMPHNLYLHSSLVQSRHVADTYSGKAEACRFNLIDSTVALNAAFFVNAAILITAAADFNSQGIIVTEIQQAHTILNSLLGNTVAPIVFAVALLAAGQSSTITGTIAGQIIMEGFLNLRIAPWLRRFITRMVALGPAVAVIAIAGNEGVYRLLVLSQVILSLQLPFAVIPLIYFTSDRKKMGMFANKMWVNITAWIMALVIIALNLKLAMEEISGWLTEGNPLVLIIVMAAVTALTGLLLYLIIKCFLPTHTVWKSAERSTVSDTVAANLRPLHLKRIGAAIEHAPGDSVIISAAKMMARSEKAELMLIHVVNTPGTSVYGKDSGSLHTDADERYLNDLSKELTEDDFLVSSDLRYGNVVNEIVAAVDEADLDLLVMGSHGHTGLSDLIHGETASNVRHRVAIPVLIVKSGKPETAIPKNDRLE